jgi:hypothetical protein
MVMYKSAPHLGATTILQLLVAAGRQLAQRFLVNFITIQSTECSCSLVRSAFNCINLKKNESSPASQKHVTSNTIDFYGILLVSECCDDSRKVKKAFWSNKRDIRSVYKRKVNISAHFHRYLHNR